MLRKMLGTGATLGTCLALGLSSAASAVPATIPAGGVSVTGMTPSSGILALTPTFLGVDCPAAATQVLGFFYGGATGTGEILESAPAEGGTYVVGDPNRLAFSIDALARSKGVSVANLSGRYTYRLTCVNDLGLAVDGGTTYYALVDINATGWTFILDGVPQPTPTVTTATTTAATTVATSTSPVITTSRPATTAPGTTASGTTTSVASATTAATSRATTIPATTTPTTSRASTTVLARTGLTGLTPLVVIGTVLLLAGAVIVVSVRRRQRGARQG